MHTNIQHTNISLGEKSLNPNLNPSIEEQNLTGTNLCANSCLHTLKVFQSKLYFVMVRYLTEFKDNQFGRHSMTE